MGSRSSGKTVTVAAGGSAAKKPGKKVASGAAKKSRPNGVEAAKYEQSGAPWWKRHLPG